MSYVTIWIHAVWGTKHRLHSLTKEKRVKLFGHMLENAKKKEIWIDTINGHTDHVHCLLALNAEMSIAKTMQLIKGESSFWANKHDLFEPKLEWADEYYACSISKSHVDAVRNYIKNQEVHHVAHNYIEEYMDFLKAMGYEVRAKANTGAGVTAPAINGGVRTATSGR